MVYTVITFTGRILYYSPGGNGKTTLLKLLHHFYNPENTTALSFNDLNDKFKPANLQGKLVNIADDMILIVLRIRAISKSL